MRSVRVAFKPTSPCFEAASARLRCYLPVRHLRQAGWNCEIFRPECLADYQAVVFQKAYGPQDQDLARSLRRRGARVVFDLCDNHWYVPQDRPEFQDRADQLKRMVDLSDIVTVSTPELARWIPRPSQVIDDCLDEVRSRQFWWDRVGSWFDRTRGSRLRLVWFGNGGMDSPPFGLIDLAKLTPELNALNRTIPLRLTVISNSESAYCRHLSQATFPHSYVEFRTNDFQRIFQRQDVCVIPVNLNPFTVCKTLNRPALALLMGVAVVADLIPSYEELRPFIAVGNWQEHLTRYAMQPGLRHRHISEGQKYLRTRYTPERVVLQWETALSTALQALPAAA